MSKANPGNIKFGPIFIWSGIVIAVSFTLVAREALSPIGIIALIGLVVGLQVFGMNFGVMHLMEKLRQDFLISPRQYSNDYIGQDKERFAAEWNDYDPDAGE